MRCLFFTHDNSILPASAHSCSSSDQFQSHVTNTSTKGLNPPAVITNQHLISKRRCHLFSPRTRCISRDPRLPTIHCALISCLMARPGDPNQIAKSRYITRPRRTVRIRRGLDACGDLSRVNISPEQATAGCK